MAPAVATRSAKRGSTAANVQDYHSASELREVIERTLEAVDKSTTAGNSLRAAGLSLRVEVSDLKAVFSIRVSNEPGHYIHWRFDRRGRPKPRLTLRMDSEVANAWLQGRESVPVAIARRRMKYTGNARDALRYLPVLKVISERYRKVVRSDYPHLAI